MEKSKKRFNFIQTQYSAIFVLKYKGSSNSRFHFHIRLYHETSRLQKYWKAQEKERERVVYICLQNGLKEACLLIS